MMKEHEMTRDILKSVIQWFEKECLTRPKTQHIHHKALPVIQKQQDDIFITAKSQRNEHFVCS